MNRKISTLFTTGLLMAGSLCGSAFAQTTIQDLLGLGAQATELENGSRYVITNPNGEAYGFTELNAGTKLLKEDVCDITSADINKDGVVIGGSAGAVIFGYDINIIASMDPNDVNLEDTKGFDVLSGISIFPHYTNRKSKYTEEENNERMKMFTDSITKYSEKIGKVIAIPEEDAIYISEEGVQVIGTKPYFVFKNGVSEKINLFDCEQRLNKKL